jgi:hypothetical protein
MTTKFNVGDIVKSNTNEQNLNPNKQYEVSVIEHGGFGTVIYGLTDLSDASYVETANGHLVLELVCEAMKKETASRSCRKCKNRVYDSGKPLTECPSCGYAVEFVPQLKKPAVTARKSGSAAGKALAAKKQSEGYVENSGAYDKCLRWMKGGNGEYQCQNRAGECPEHDAPKPIKNDAHHPNGFSGGKGAYVLVLARGYDRTVVGLFERNDAGSAALEKVRDAMEPFIPEGSKLEIHA